MKIFCNLKHFKTARENDTWVKNNFLEMAIKSFRYKMQEKRWWLTLAPLRLLRSRYTCRASVVEM